MSKFDKDCLIYAADLIELKSRVKSEMQRRCKNGSISSYGDSSWDYEEIPQKDNPVKEEHYAKIRTPISKISEENLPPQEVKSMPSLTSLDARLEINRSQSGKSSTSHGCNASCTGLCYNSCNSCTGCTGCSGCGGCGGCSGCSGTCSGSCTDSCEGCTGCSTGCLGCTGTCQGHCTSCTGGCKGCTGSCTGSCSGCGDQCTGCTGCSGCGGSCSSKFMFG